MSLTNYYSMMGLQAEESYGAHLIPGSLQISNAGCAKSVRGARDVEEDTPGSHIPDISHFSNKQSSLNGFSPWTNTSTSSPSPSPLQQPAAGASIAGLFQPHHLLSHHHQYYGAQTQSHTAEHLACSASSEGRFVRCWEEVTPGSDATVSQAAFPAGCLSGQSDHSTLSSRYETVKPENSSPPSNGSPGDSSYASAAEVVLERLGTVEELGGNPEPKKEKDEKTQHQEQQQQFDPGKDSHFTSVFTVCVNVCACARVRV